MGSNTVISKPQASPKQPVETRLHNPVHLAPTTRQRPSAQQDDL